MPKFGFAVPVIILMQTSFVSGSLAQPLVQPQTGPSRAQMPTLTRVTTHSLALQGIKSVGPQLGHAARMVTGSELPRLVLGLLALPSRTFRMVASHLQMATPTQLLPTTLAILDMCDLPQTLEAAFMMARGRIHQ